MELQKNILLMIWINLTKKWDFGYKLNFWLKIEILTKKSNFDERWDFDQQFNFWWKIQIFWLEIELLTTATAEIHGLFSRVPDYKHQCLCSVLLTLAI